MKKILVWDWPIRVMHWLIVVLFTGMIITGKSDEDYMQWHFYMGYGLSAVVIARVLYGFWGSKFARFSEFLYHPIETTRFVSTLLTGKGRTYLGHNPVGGLMVIVLLVALSLQWITGLFNSDQVFWYGPFYEWGSNAVLETAASLHYQLPDILLALVAMHILAVLYHELRFKERLIGAMLHGKKPLHHDERDIKETNPPVQTPRLGVTVALVASLAWLAWLWSLPI